MLSCFSHFQSDLPNPGMNPPLSPALAGRFFTTNATSEVPIFI